MYGVYQSISTYYDVTHKKNKIQNFQMCFI